VHKEDLMQDATNSEDARIIPLSEDDQRTMSSIMQRAVSQVEPEGAMEAEAAARVRNIGVYLDPPGVCVGVTVRW
jgi:hypothetical protein